MWKFGNSNWTPTLQQQLDREKKFSNSARELQSESSATATSTLEAFGRAVPSLVFTSVEEMRINQRS